MKSPKILALMVLLLTANAGAQESHDAHHAATTDPVEVAGRYLAAMESSDLEAAEALFAEGSSVFETGGREGGWKEYREHHIGPELDQISDFEVTRKQPESLTSEDGSMAFVAWPIEYHIELADGRVIDSKGTVTFVLVAEEGAFRIRHLHWSSRRKP